jgi:hypothetical protein
MVNIPRTETIWAWQENVPRGRLRSPEVKSARDAGVVPDLTCTVDIKLNQHVSLRRHQAVVYHRTIPPRPDPAWQSRRAIIFRLAALF